MFDFLKPSSDDLKNRAWAAIVHNGLVADHYDVIVVLHGETVPIAECVTHALASGAARLINSTLMVCYGLEDVFRDRSQPDETDNNSPPAV